MKLFTAIAFVAILSLAYSKPLAKKEVYQWEDILNNAENENYGLKAETKEAAKNSIAKEQTFTVSWQKLLNELAQQLENEQIVNKQDVENLAEQERISVSWHPLLKNKKIAVKQNEFFNDVLKNVGSTLFRRVADEISNSGKADQQEKANEERIYWDYGRRLGFPLSAEEQEVVEDQDESKMADEQFDLGKVVSGLLHNAANKAVSRLVDKAFNKRRG